MNMRKRKKKRYALDKTSLYIIVARRKATKLSIVGIIIYVHFVVIKDILRHLARRIKTHSTS